MPVSGLVAPELCMMSGQVSALRQRAEIYIDWACFDVKSSDKCSLAKGKDLIGERA